jgi:hypothetical protein
MTCVAARTQTSLNADETQADEIKDELTKAPTNWPRLRPWWGERCDEPRSHRTRASTSSP